MRVTRDALRQIRGGHPWVFDSSITSTSHDGAPGDLAVVFDDRRRFAAIGLWDPASPIRVRVVHQGAPTPIDPAFWADRVAATIRRRGDLVDDADTTAWRVVHGENDGFPGLVVDRYGSTFVAKVYSAAWIPHLADVVAAVVDLLAPEALIVRFGRNVDPGARAGLAEGTALLGHPPAAPVGFRENGLAFAADLVAGHKTGHFVDQRDNRARVRDLAAGARVLDVFACTGGFSVHAAAGGAASVHAVDLSGPALRAARHNLAINASRIAGPARRLAVTVGDAFEVLDELARTGERFDLVVVDPPSFTRRAGDVDAATRAYRTLTTLAVACVAPDGVLVQSSCSSRVGEATFFATVLAAAETAGRPLDEIARTGHAADHPIGFAQGAYLKTLFARVGSTG